MEKKHWIWLGVAIVALVILWLLLRRKSSVDNGINPTFDAPNFLTYNFGPRNIAGTSSGLPSVGTVDTTQSACGCSAGSQQLLSGFQALMNYFTGAAKASFDQYENVVTSNIPNIAAQFFNNPGYAQDANAAQIFTGGTSPYRVL